jgi:hypothetical protein
VNAAVMGKKYFDMIKTDAPYRMGKSYQSANEML